MSNYKSNRELGIIDGKMYYVDSPNVYWLIDPNNDNRAIPYTIDKNGRIINIPLVGAGIFNDSTNFNNDVFDSISMQNLRDLRTSFPYLNMLDKNKYQVHVDNGRLVPNYTNNSTPYEQPRSPDRYTPENKTPNTSPKNNKLRRIGGRGSNPSTRNFNSSGLYKEFKGGFKINEDEYNNYSTSNYAKCDFFDLLGLSRVSTKNRYNSFIPIILKSDCPYPLDTETGSENVEVVLPMKGATNINDVVSVSYSRRSDSALPWMNMLSGLASKTAENLGFSGEHSASIGNIVQFTYQTSSLKKVLNINYIIPVTAATKQVNLDEIRQYLSFLQGMLYPSGLSGYTYPPMLSLTIGGMYTRFFGFLTEVAIDWGPNGEFVHYDENGSDQYGVFPQIIEGSIRFESLFMYQWKSNWTGNFSEFNKKFFTIRDGSETKTSLFGIKDGDIPSAMYSGQSIQEKRENYNTLINSENNADEDMFNRVLSSYNWDDDIFGVPRKEDVIFTSL